MNQDHENLPALPEREPALPVQQQTPSGMMPTNPAPNGQTSNGQAPSETTPTGQKLSPTLIVGIGVLFMGTVLMLDNLGFQSAHFLWRFWPLIIVALGVLKLSTTRGSRTSGYLILGTGVILSVSTIFNIDLGNLIGPLLIIALGIWIVLHALKKHRQVPPNLIESEDFVKGLAIFSAYKHHHPRKPFRGGELTAIFGGTELNLRDAEIVGSHVRLDCFVMFGGSEIIVPEGWDVRLEAKAMFGGADNKSVPLPSGVEGRPVLNITGMVLFGGIEVTS